MIEYYVKMCQEHPLVTYIEDPFGDNDMDGYRRFKEALATAGLSHVKVGMKNIFRDSNLLRVRDVTSIRPLTAEEQVLEKESKNEEAKRPTTNEVPGKKGNTTAAAAAKVDLGTKIEYKSPNADKFVPNCVSIRTSPLSTVSDLFDFVRYSASMPDENRFSLIIDDQVHEEI